MSAKTMPLASITSVGLYSARSEACPSGHTKLLDKQIGLFFQEDWDVFQSEIWAVPWEWQSAKYCLIVTVSWGPGKQAVLPPETGDQGVFTR